MHARRGKRIDNPQFPVSFELTNADVMVQGSELRGMLDVVPGWIEMDRQARHSQATSKAAMRRTRRCRADGISKLRWIQCS